ncbi:hypothetical protein GGR57DRAFT_515878 [Xylariaceae sp. FL1272]|nr:hypothetical protein GGR57DRAFT_515878 [Xylariaceae sp. FL1272]
MTSPKKTYQRHKRNRGQQLIGGAFNDAVGDKTEPSADVGTSGGSGQGQVGARAVPSSSAANSPAPGPSAVTTGTNGRTTGQRIVDMLVVGTPAYTTFLREYPNAPDEILDKGRQYVKDMLRLGERFRATPTRVPVDDFKGALANYEDLVENIHAFKDQQAGSHAVETHVPVAHETDDNAADAQATKESDLDVAEMNQTVDLIARAQQQVADDMLSAAELACDIATNLNTWLKQLREVEGPGDEVGRHANSLQNKQSDQEEEKAWLSRRTIEEAQHVTEELQKLLLEDSDN